MHIYNFLQKWIFQNSEWGVKGCLDFSQKKIQIGGHWHPVYKKLKFIKNISFLKIVNNSQSNQICKNGKKAYVKIVNKIIDKKFHIGKNVKNCKKSKKCQNCQNDGQVMFPYHCGHVS